ncbi:hypothetical protein ACR6C2_14110 [Streptomyces sp. INA 01156]
MAGSVSAFDAEGEEKWRWRNDLPMCASVLATGGDLVFAGEPSGSSTRSTPAPGSCCGSSSAGAATTATRPPTRSTAGSTSSCRSVGGWAEGFLPGMLGAGHGSALIAFALPESS